MSETSALGNLIKISQYVGSSLRGTQITGPQKLLNYIK